MFQILSSVLATGTTIHKIVISDFIDSFVHLFNVYLMSQFSPYTSLTMTTAE